MKILVLNPSSKVTKNVVRDVLYGCWCKGKRIGGGTVPPFALLQAATILSKNHDVTFLDAQAESLSCDAVGKLVPDYHVVVVSTSTMSFREDADYLLALKRANPGVRTVMFGSHPTFMPRYCLAHKGVDIIVLYEPEFILRDLMDSMSRGGEEWKETRGIGYPENGQPHINERYPFIEDLDELPFPDVTMLPRGIDYFNPLVRKMPYMAVTTSKGCPGRCVFCTAPYFDGMKLRFQSAGYVLREIEYFLGKGYREIFFRDDTFFVQKNRDHEICRQISERRLGISWLANARVNLMDRDTMEVAKAAGCHTIKFGIESGVQSILDNMRKGYRLEQARQVFKWAHEVGMNTHAHVMLGNPGDTLETVKQTIEFTKELRPTTATFGICTPYPGTPLFQQVADAFPEIADGSASDLSKLHVEGLYNEQFSSLTSLELNGLVQRAYRSFYLRPSHWVTMLKTQFRSIDDLKRVSLAAANVLDFIFRGD